MSEKKIKNICFICDFYPTKELQKCVFVKKLVDSIAIQNINCTVIDPQMILVGKKNKKNIPYKRVKKLKNGSKIIVYSPYYNFYSSHRFLMKKSMNAHYKAVDEVIYNENIKFDAIYGHFIYQSGITAIRIGEKYDIPSFFACGESASRLFADSYPYSIGLKYYHWKKYLNSASGIISVSTENKELLIKNNFVKPSMESNILVRPNGVDLNKFTLMDKKKIRKKLGISENLFIIVFVGAFIERKGVNRLVEAIKPLEDVHAIFIGKGPLKINFERTIFKNTLENELIPEYLNASDIFVLPTNAEGCCNAIIEALACGLPVISSKKKFNDDILNHGNSIRIDEMNIKEIREAIILLKEDRKKLNELSKGAQESVIPLDIRERAISIINYIETRSYEYKN